MLQIWVIMLFAAAYVRDSLGGPGGLSVPLAVRANILSSDPARWRAESASITLGGLLVIVAATHLLVRGAARRVDRRGSWRAVILADRVLGLSRAAIVALYAFAVIALGWLDTVRWAIGDVVALDELLAMTPALLAIIAGWWSYYPIERQLREATMVRSLDDGVAVYPTPTCRQYVWSGVRHNLLFTGVPVAMVLAWTETLVFGHDRLVRWHQEAVDHGAVTSRLFHAVEWLLATRGGVRVEYALQLLGVAAVIIGAPMVVRLVWDTVPFQPGPLRERLLQLCRAERIRVRELLVWRTHGTMVNGAVVGFLGSLRYILLTDALLDGLPARQVEAVMAHEIAHIRRHHLVWFVVAMVSATGLVSVAAAGIGLLVGPTDDQGAGEWLSVWSGIIQLGVLLAGLAIGLAVFGFVSRRFEWQADAFAAAHLSQRTPPPATEPAGTITAESVHAMAGALESVARLNHVPRRRFSWRHGSIADRQDRLANLVGRPIDRLPIDHTVRWLKRSTAVAFAAVLLFSLLSP